MESSSNAGENKYEELLESDPSHIYMNAAKDLINWGSSPGHTPTNELYDEGDDVQQDEEDGERGGTDAEDGGSGEEVVNHATQNHVIKSVNPYRTYHEAFT